MLISRERIEDFYKELEEQAVSCGYNLNTDKEFVEELIKGILVNQSRYGYWSCPCRLASGNKKEDIDIICPCDYRDEDIADHDACYCGLYVSGKVNSGEVRLSCISERRPSREECRQFIVTKTPFSNTLPYPVWRCRVCGYICARNEPPELCPICKVKKERFERFI